METDYKDPLTVYKEKVLRRQYDETMCVFEYIDPVTMLENIKAIREQTQSLDVLKSIGLASEELLESSIFTDISDYGLCPTSGSCSCDCASGDDHGDHASSDAADSEMGRSAHCNEA